MLPAFRLYAVLGTWMEADVVEATVKNAFMQGCERVFLVDNDSQDDTLDVAVGAGAEDVDTYSTEHFDDSARTSRLNECVAEISEADGAEHIWWLWLDADEFPHGPRGLAIREYLASLDESFRIVGARYLNHYPGDPPHYVPGLHPLDFQPLAEELLTRFCWLWHRKHPLQRFDRDRPRIRSIEGFHRGLCDQPLLEPAEPVFVHHFPFRERETTERRMHALFARCEAQPSIEGEDIFTAHMMQRFRTLDAVYDHDWRHVDMRLTRDCRRPREEPVPWTQLVEPDDVPVARWYDASQVETRELEACVG